MVESHKLQWRAESKVKIEIIDTEHQMIQSHLFEGDQKFWAFKALITKKTCIMSDSYLSEGNPK